MLSLDMPPTWQPQADTRGKVCTEPSAVSWFVCDKPHWHLIGCWIQIMGGAFVSGEDSWKKNNKNVIKSLSHEVDQSKGTVGKLHPHPTTWSLTPCRPAPPQRRWPFQCRSPGSAAGCCVPRWCWESTDLQQRKIFGNYSHGPQVKKWVWKCQVSAAHIQHCVRRHWGSLGS